MLQFYTKEPSIVITVLPPAGTVIVGPDADGIVSKLEADNV